MQKAEEQGLRKNLSVHTSLIHDHDALLIGLAAIVCLLGSYVTVSLSRRTVEAKRLTKAYWCFLTSMCAGASIWATHFIAMLGYQPGMSVNIDVPLTLLSALIAALGAAIALIAASIKHPVIAASLGGTVLGLSISAMHYLGMLGYRPEGTVRWLPEFVTASIACAIVFSILSFRRVISSGSKGDKLKAAVFLFAAIIFLHFLGMAGFNVTPISQASVAADGDLMIGMASAIAVASILVVGTGVAAFLVEENSRQAQQRLHEMALHDALTQLGNRRSFEIELRSRCENLSEGGSPFALLMIDLDRFKTINDTLGHPVGDQILKMVAVRLRKIAENEDTIARIGGDEFAIILHNVSDKEQATVRAALIVELLSRPFLLGGQVVETGSSVGLSLAPADSDDAETLLKQVDVALYRAKNDGSGRCHAFNPTLLSEMVDRGELEADLRRAITREELEVEFQPILDARDCSFIGAEALVRWHCSKRGNVSPRIFVPILEELGLIHRVGKFVLEQACEAAVGWPEHLSVSVNVSQSQIANAWLAPTISNALSRSGLAANRLEIEITETAFVGDQQHALRCLEQVRDLGVSVALDDFGTGYSSLSYLHHYPIDRIKIDSSFVTRLPDDTGSASIVSAICTLGKSLNLQLTAEGIETEQQHSFIQEMGCHAMQGYLFNRPVSSELITELFAESVRRVGVA